jgi:putative ABC transport system permease protein
MLWLRRLLLTLPWIRHSREQSLNEELQSHLDLAAREARNDGASPEHAHWVARRDLGSTLRTQEQARNEWLLPGLEHTSQDARYAFRTLAQAPLFTSVAIVSLALGIGAATAIFSLVEGVLLKPLAYPEPGRLVYVQEFVPALSHIYPALPVNLQHFFYWRDHNKMFDSIAALRSERPTLTGIGEPVSIDGVETTADLFRVLRVGMAQGRGFHPGEDKPGRNHIAVVTDAFWRQRLSSKPDVIGTRIVLEGVPTAIVGVLPRNFTFPKDNDLGLLAGLGKRSEIFRPLQRTIDEWDGDYDYICLGRLRAGITSAQGRAELEGLTNQLAAAYHVESRPRPTFRPLQDLIAGPLRLTLWTLFAAVLALLLIVCVNLANLTLARSSVRAREFSIRAALGAGRTRLVQQVMTETALLSIGGGALGIVLANLAVRLFVVTSGISLPRLDEVAVDGRVLFFASLLTILCAAIFGIIPALRIIRSDPQEALKSATQTASSTKESLRLRQILVGFEVALSTVLLFLAGLLISSVVHVLNIDKGFTQDQAISIDLGLPDVQYPTVRDRNLFFDRVLAGVRSIPGVTSAAMIMGLPLSGESHVNGIELEPSDQKWIAASKSDSVLLNVRFISSDYFSTLGIPLLHGRPIEGADANRHVAVVSERLAAKVWPAQNPLGKRFKTGSGVGPVQVIGVVKDVHNGRLDEAPTLIVYAPYGLRGPTYGSLVLRTPVPSAQLMQAVRKEIWSIDPGIPVPPFVRMQELVDKAVSTRRFQMQLSTAFGLGALALALIGIYGVVAYNVAARRTEIGIRLALGARPGDLIVLLTWRGLRPVFMGLAIGLLGAAICGWLVRSLLFGVHAIDPLTLAAATLVLAITACAACLVPACAITRMDPANSLHYE